MVSGAVVTSARVHRRLPLAARDGASQPSAPSEHGASRCHTCPLGAAARVAQGGRCPFVARDRDSGALLYVEGAAADQIWYVQRGFVGLSREAGEARGPGVIWAVRRAGEMLGVEALVRGAYRDSARTLSPTTLCAASREAVDRWLGPPDAPARALLQLALRSRGHESPRRSGADGPASRRAARWLLDDAEGDAPPIPRHVVADLLGMTPETLSRALAALAATGAVAVDRRSVRVLDRDALRRAAGV